MCLALTNFMQLEVGLYVFEILQDIATKLEDV
jgi:hypothetical protein